jgi:hypothetical protein
MASRWVWQRYVLVCETVAARITRLWIAGPRAGERETFLDGLPAYVDNLSYNGAGVFWVGLVGSRKADYERHTSRPRLRQALTRIPRAKIPHPTPWVHGAPRWAVIAVHHQRRLVTAVLGKVRRDHQRQPVRIRPLRRRSDHDLGGRISLAGAV